MKKTISLLLSLAMCMSLASTAFATAFTASVESKSAPAVVEVTDEEGNAAIATLNGDLPDGTEAVTDIFLVVTAVADAETSVEIPDDSKEALLEVYNGLQDGSIQVPFEELDKENAENLVIRDLFDVSWTDVEGNDYKQLLDKEGVTLEMTFAMDVEADAKVYVMVYKNNAWTPIENVTNNGDGTITCVFNHLCPVAVIVEENETMEVVNVTAEDAGAASGQNLTLWIVILAAAVLALAALFAGKKRKQK